MTRERTFSFKEVAWIVRGNLLAWGVVSVVFCAIPAILVAFQTPDFESLFKGFGADLPAGTKFAVRWRNLIWLFPAVNILLTVFALTMRPAQAVARHVRIVITFAVVCVVSMIAHGLLVAALYAPIFELGAVV